MSKRSRSRRVMVCLRCGESKWHEARGLCKCCYNHLREGRCKKGESLDDYPPIGGFGQWSGMTANDHQPQRHYDPGFIARKETRHDLPAAS